MLENLSAIQMRMQEIQARFSSFASPVAPASVRPPETSGTSFSQILATLQDGQGTAFKGAIGGSEAEFTPLINEAAQKWNLDPALLKAVVKQESGFNPSATSPVGAQGLMQLMPETAKSLGVTNSLDPRENLMGGARYLRGLLDRFDGNLTKALAAYNAGPGAVEEHGGVPPYRETQNYVANILAMYGEFRKKA